MRYKFLNFTYLLTPGRCNPSCFNVVNFNVCKFNKNRVQNLFHTINECLSIPLHDYLETS